MKVILLSDVKKVGQRGSVVEVADGYAQNVLIPKRFAVPATAHNLKQAEKRDAQALDRRAMNEVLAKKALGGIDGKSVSIKVRANDVGGLFEAVRSKQVAEAVQATLGVSIPEEAFQMEEPLKKIGVYDIAVVYGGAKAKVHLELGQ